MKILVLAADARERGIIQSALEKGRHEVFSAGNAAEALGLVQASRPRMTILDDDIGIDQKAQFIGGIKDSGDPPIYVLILSAGPAGTTESDDTLRKPFTATELTTRIVLAQRFLALGDSLTEARVRIDNMALYDALTGLMNQSAFLRAAKGELERARRGSAPISVISLELSNFQDLQAAYGITAGDEALRAVAATIRERSRPYDVIGRWSGEEFVEALPGVIGDDAKKIAERIIKGVLASEIAFEEQPLTVGISAGIASVLQIHASTEIQPLIEQSRHARARAKEMGGNQVFLTFG